MKTRRSDSSDVRSVVSDLTYPSISYSSESRLWTDELSKQLEGRYIQLQQEWQNSSPPQESLGFPYVQYLYRYRTFDPTHPERTEAVFAEKKIWASSIDRLNDPLEAAFVCSQQAVDAVEKDAISMLMKSNWCGCICFSYDPVCPQMWAHYAAEHSGFCIEYRRIESRILCSTLCQPVMYRRTIPVINDVLNFNIGQILWTKSEAWEYEREWRLQYPRANAYTAPGLLIPTSVIFGLRTDAKTKDFLRGCAKEVRFGQIEPAREPYKLRIHWEGNSHEEA